MGLRWSTPRVMGVSYSTRLGPSRSVGCLPMLGLFLILGGVVEVAHGLSQMWFAFAALLGALAWSIQWMRRQQAAALFEPRNQSQASVSNRR